MPRRRPQKSRSSSGGGLLSSAGIMRYYDADESKVTLQPRTVIVLCVVLAVAVLAFNHFL